MLRKRLLLALISFVSISIGLIIYLTLRENTYIHLFVGETFSDKLYIEHSKTNPFIIFIKYYFVDFLWCLSLLFALASISFSFSKKLIIAISIVSFVLGVLFEILQYYCLVNGTFDVADIVMYLIASIVGSAINIELLKE